MILKKLFLKTLRFSGLPVLFREVFQRKKVSIVMFHDLGPEEARRAFSYLASRYNIISLETYLEARKKGTCHLLPPKSLIITLDDGYASNHQIVPVVRELQIPITIFLCSGLLDTKRHFWFLFRQREMGHISVKDLPNKQRLAVLGERGFHQDREFSEPHALSREQIQEMKGIVNLQAHTQYHPFLSKCTDPEAWEEIHGAKHTLEKDYGLAINAIAFPHGDYTDRDIEMIKKSGYQCAITVDYGFNTPSTDIYRLKRLSVDDSGDIDLLSLKASGVWAFLRIITGSQSPTGWSKVYSNCIANLILLNNLIDVESGPFFANLFEFI